MPPPAPSPVYHHPSTVVRACEYGWGVFASARIDADVLVESCPYLVVPEADTHAQPLCDYVFKLTDDPADPDHAFRAVALGWGALFNHANEPNLRYAAVPRRKLLQFTTTRTILAGEQLFVSYGAAWWNYRARG